MSLPAIQTRENHASIPDVTKTYIKKVAEPAKLVGGLNPDATVLVIDQFESSEHGDKVVDVMKRAGLQESNIQRIEHPFRPLELSDLLKPGSESPSRRIDTFIELKALHFIQSTYNIISDATAEGSKIKTISHSMASHAMRIGMDVYYMVEYIGKEDKKRKFLPGGPHILAALGLEADLSSENLQEAKIRAIQRAEKVISGSAKVKALQRAFDQKLGELQARSISYFPATGNSQDDLERQQEVMELDQSAVLSLLSVPSANLVGAIDTKGTADTADDELANFSTLDPNVKFLAKGVDVTVGTPDGGEKLVNGTSYAAPFVAARHEQARRVGLELQNLPNVNDNWSGPLAVLQP